MTDGAEVKSKQGWLSTLGWAAYLACSWTWCIGMFLPVLLVRDYGIWGFVVFAVPNVLGAGAMGWVLTPDASRRVTQTHRFACAIFSVITIAFQVYFLSGLTEPLREVGGGRGQRWQEFLVMAVLAAVATVAMGRARTAAVIVWSASAFLLGFSAWSLGAPEVPEKGGLPAADVLYLAPVCVFGFLLCPYLDLTFHRARQSARKSGRAAFAVGFGVLFFGMILGTLVYSQSALGWMMHRSLPERLVVGAVGAHILLQLTITATYHAHEFDAAFSKRRSARIWMTTLGVLLVVAGLLVVRTKVLDGALSGREVVYRLFMSFYGLLFPAYVWLCMIPARGEKGTQKPTRQKLTVLAIACTLAAPCYWMGFIERETVWLVPGLGVVLVARLFIKKSMNEAASPATGGGEQT